MTTIRWVLRQPGLHIVLGNACTGMSFGLALSGMRYPFYVSLLLLALALGFVGVSVVARLNQLADKEEM